MSRSTASNVLLFGGIGIAVVGGVAAILLKQQADRDALVNAYADTLLGIPGVLSPNYTGSIVAGVIAGIGVVMVIIFLATRAVRSDAP